MTEQGWCQNCNNHTKEGEMSQLRGGENWYFLCPECKRVDGKAE